MKVKVQIVIEHEEVADPIVEEVACFCRGDLLPETLGLTLDEGKELLANIQTKMVSHQAAAYVEEQRPDGLMVWRTCSHNRLLAM